MNSKIPNTFKFQHKSKIKKFPKKKKRKEKAKYRSKQKYVRRTIIQHMLSDSPVSIRYVARLNYTI